MQVQTLAIGGRANCNGHGNSSWPVTPSGPRVCQCQHGKPHMQILRVNFTHIYLPNKIRLARYATLVCLASIISHGRTATPAKHARATATQTRKLAVNIEE